MRMKGQHREENKMMKRNDKDDGLARRDDRPAARSLWFDPWDDFDRFFKRFFDQPALAPSMARSFELTGTPSVDIIDEETRILVKAEMPGVPKENVEVEVDGDMLEIKANIEHEEEEKDKNYLRRERRCTTFYRTFMLPDNVDKEGVHASMRDGLLMVTVPKKEPSKAKKKSVKVE